MAHFSTVFYTQDSDFPHLSVFILGFCHTISPHGTALYFFHYTIFSATSNSFHNPCLIGCHYTVSLECLISYYLSLYLLASCLLLLLSLTSLVTHIRPASPLAAPWSVPDSQTWPCLQDRIRIQKLITVWVLSFNQRSILNIFLLIILASLELWLLYLAMVRQAWIQIPYQAVNDQITQLFHIWAA